jgi:hypothetical protein
MFNALILSSILALSSAAASKHGASFHVHHSKSESSGHTWRNLKIFYISRDKGLTVSWDGRSGRHEQRIKFPTLMDKGDTEPFGWWLTSYTSQRLRPHAFLWFYDSSVSLVFISSYLTAAYGVQAPIIYTLHGSKWKRLPFDPMKMSFTNRGTFYIQGNRVYVCDYGGEVGYAHLAPQHYWLDTFVVKNDHVRKLHTRWTYHRYPIPDADPPPLDYPAKIDPLRELGLRWRYWGKGRKGIKISGD